MDGGGGGGGGSFHWDFLARGAVNSFCKVNMETITDEVLQRHYGPGIVVAEIRYASPQVALT